MSYVLLYIVRVLPFCALLHGDVTITFLEGDGGQQWHYHYYISSILGLCVSLVCWLISFLWIFYVEALCGGNARNTDQGS
jgi:hypothetical protein